jgi:molecular chaperone DnaK
VKKKQLRLRLKELDEAIKGSDKAAIEAKTEALGKASQKLGEKAFAAEQAKAGGGAAPGAAGASASQGGPADADVVDADFKEVKEDKK